MWRGQFVWAVYNCYRWLFKKWNISESFKSYHDTVIHFLKNFWKYILPCLMSRKQFYWVLEKWFPPHYQVDTEGIRATNSNRLGHINTEFLLFIFQIISMSICVHFISESISFLWQISMHSRYTNFRYFSNFLGSNYFNMFCSLLSMLSFVLTKFVYFILIFNNILKDQNGSLTFSSAPHLVSFCPIFCACWHSRFLLSVWFYFIIGECSFLSDSLTFCQFKALGCWFYFLWPRHLVRILVFLLICSALHRLSPNLRVWIHTVSHTSEDTCDKGGGPPQINHEVMSGKETFAVVHQACLAPRLDASSEPRIVMCR